MIVEYSYLYTEINIFCTVLAVLVFIRSGGSMRLTSHRVFQGAIVSMIVFILADNIAFMLANGILPFSKSGVLFFKSLYFMATTVTCCFWYQYFECMREEEIKISRGRLTLMLVPVVLQLILEVVNWNAGFFCYVDGETYRRGKLFIVQYIFAYAYVVVAMIRALLAGLREKNYVDRDRIVTIALFPVFPALAGILQFFYPHLPLACAAMTLSLLILYFNLTDSVISLDPLTKLNNRRVLMHNISKRMKDQQGESDLYLLMIDANLFKSINDNYGHIEGDKALIRIAESLKAACLPLGRRPMIARFGGDEFVIVANLVSEEEKDQLIERIHSLLLKRNRDDRLPYELSVSVGAARYSDDIKTVKEFMNRADEKLYEVKKKRKTGQRG